MQTDAEKAAPLKSHDMADRSRRLAIRGNTNPNLLGTLFSCIINTIFVHYIQQCPITLPILNALLEGFPFPLLRMLCEATLSNSWGIVTPYSLISLAFSYPSAAPFGLPLGKWVCSLTMRLAG